METWHCEDCNCPIERVCPFFNESTEYCQVEKKLELSDKIKEIAPTAFELAYALEDLELNYLEETVGNLKSLCNLTFDADSNESLLYRNTYKAKTGKEWVSK